MRAIAQMAASSPGIWNRMITFVRSGSGSGISMNMPVSEMLRATHHCSPTSSEKTSTGKTLSIRDEPRRSWATRMAGGSPGR
ncbi:hypothetical protein [Nannocystis pusilla]|uniref:hypothetical protein n=1 Tax=Nannocystis pusilla TaxID=889268 RepID=UPI003B7FC191